MRWGVYGLMKKTTGGRMLWLVGVGERNNCSSDVLGVCRRLVKETTIGRMYWGVYELVKETTVGRKY